MYVYSILCFSYHLPSPLLGQDLESLLYHFMDEWLFLFSADPFFIPKVCTSCVHCVLHLNCIIQLEESYMCGSCSGFLLCLIVYLHRNSKLLTLIERISRLLQSGK